MRYNCSFLSFFSLLFVLLFSVSLLAPDSAHEKTGSKHRYYVKVLLAQAPVKSIVSGKRVAKAGKEAIAPVSWEITSPYGFLLSDGTDASEVIFCKSSVLTITIKNNYFYLNNKKYLKNSLKISPKEGDLCFGRNYYQGDFILLLQNKKALLINKLDLEAYVFAVLRAESWPGWPFEVNQIFAIAIRTYVARRAKEAKKSGRFYHVKNNNSHQTYRGYKYKKRNDALLKKAVEKTKGLVLVYDDEIIDPLYDSCCGSVITADIENNINFEVAPYLARKEPCHYCKKCSLYNWDVSYSTRDLEKLLCDACPHIRHIKSLWVSRRDAAGLVKEVTIRCARRTFKIAGEKLYGLLKAVKSFCFSIKKEGNTFVITGRGYGHHIGLCQWGARQMVRELRELSKKRGPVHKEPIYKRVLKFYYPGTTFVKIS